MKKTFSLILSFAMVLALLPSAAFAYSDAYGSEVWQERTMLHNGVTLDDNIWWSHYYEQLRHEYFVTVDPLSAVKPVVAYGEAVCDRLTATDAAKYYEAQGWRVVAGINGDFYDTATGFPLGLTVSGGKLISGSDINYAFGILSDGTAIIGEPNLSITAEHHGKKATVAALNKPRVEGSGMTLLTHDFRSDHTTGTHTDGLTVLCSILYGSTELGSSITLGVNRLIEGSQPVEIADHQVALTVAANGIADARNFLKSLSPGDMLTVSFSADERWNTVTEAVGAMYLLVENGKVVDKLSTSYAPRSAVGIKANGELVFYTVDGRQAEHSMGASLRVLAQRMAELGCETAVCLDGGGSTTLTATVPGSDTAEVINSPSDKAERKVSNHLLLLARDYASYVPGHISLHADAHVVLPGHAVPLRATLVDTNFCSIPGEIRYECSAGEIVDGVFYAPMTGGPVTITAFARGCTAQTQVLVVDTPDELHVYWNGASVSDVTMFPGDTAQITVTAMYNHQKLETFPTDFTWELEESLGRFDDTGTLTTSFTEGSGTVRVSKGDLTVSIPLTLDGRSPFADTAGHWGTGYLCSLYHRGILTGVQDGNRLLANPDNGVTRAEFAVLLARFMNLNTDDYADITTPFEDMDQVPSWAANAVRAMYALGIVGGVQQWDGTVIYDPSGVLSRAQAVTMLGRAREASVASADLSVFSDAGDIPSYALEHFETMVALGVINGAYGKLNPNDPMTRAQICKVLATLP